MTFGAASAAGVLVAALLGVSGCPGPQKDASGDSEGAKGTGARVPLLAWSAQGSAVPEPPPPSFPPKGAENTPFGGHLGMDEASFHKLFPGVTLSPSYGQGHTEGAAGGLAGTWTYTFKEGKLSWVLFDRYIDEITRANFDRCLAATDAIIADYTRRYGTPGEVKRGTRVFMDPRVDHHWGYDVMEARWIVDEMKVDVRFHFMGGKGEYHFLVSAEFGPKDAL